MQTNIMDSNIVGDFKSNFFKSLENKNTTAHKNTKNNRCLNTWGGEEFLKSENTF